LIIALSEYMLYTTRKIHLYTVFRKADYDMGEPILKDLKGSAYEILKEKLINCEYLPGSMLNENQLSSAMGVSRTPIREALTRIEHEGFVKIIPKKGIYVTDVSLSDVLQIFDCRIEIEPIALKMAAPRLSVEHLLDFKARFAGEEPDVRSAFRVDTAMHLFIIEHCGNRFIIDMMRRLFEENMRVIISSKQNEVKIHDARREHLEIIELLLDGKIDEASTAMRNHIKCCKKSALDFFYNSQSYYAQANDTTYRSYLPYAGND